MHFVKKVPTSEEEKAAKKKEHDKRAKQYLLAKDRIVEKRMKGEYDDEILSLTQQVLEKNADIYTFWNIRRTAIQQRIDENKRVQEDSVILEEEKRKSQKLIETLLSGELFLSYECIKGNPKSYSAWFQRAWVLERQTEPDLKKELALCEKALQLDCRNFHCWDHRRIVARLAKRSEEEEFEFSNKLIEENFSNYSAWHYRSIALKKLCNSKTGGFILDDATISQELDKVKNAFYMDAEDQSAWTYTRWLLEVGSGKEFLRPESCTPISLISASFHGNNTTIVFSRACSLDFVLTFVNTEDRERWRAFSSTSSNPKSSRVWQYLSDSPLQVVGNLEEFQLVDISEKPVINQEMLLKIYDASPIDLPNSIARLLEDCKQLMELEPGNKWPIYMRTLALMEYTPVAAHEEILKNLEKLGEELDMNRKELYKSVSSRQKLNQALRENQSIRKIMEGESDVLQVRNMGITSLEGVEYLSGLIGNLDISGNHLEEIHRIVLPNLHSLTANENPIRRLSPSPSLCHLKFLSVAGSRLAEVDDVMSCLQLTPSLNRFVFCETGLVEKSEQLRAQLPGVRLIPFWL